MKLVLRPGRIRRPSRSNRRRLNHLARLEHRTTTTTTMGLIRILFGASRIATGSGGTELFRRRMNWRMIGSIGIVTMPRVMRTSIGKIPRQWRSR